MKLRIGACSAVALAIMGMTGVVSAAPQDDVSILMVERRSPCDEPEWWIESTNSSSTYEYKVRVQSSVRASVGTAENCTVQDDVVLVLERTGSSNACQSLSQPFPQFAGCDCCCGAGCGPKAPNTAANSAACPPASGCTGTSCCVGTGWQPVCNSSECRCNCWQNCPCSSIQNATVTIIAQRTPPGDWQSILPVAECDYDSTNPQLDDCPLASVCKGNAPANPCD